jgi:hemoglobin
MTQTGMITGRTGGIDEAGIRALVFGFYDRVRHDDLIGPVFNARIEAGRWPEHLEKMCAFWSSVLLRTRDYEGRPLRPHLMMPELSESHFRRWLGLFRETAESVFSAADAAHVVGMGERIAHSFRLSIAMHRGEDSLAVAPIRAGS